MIAVGLFLVVLAFALFSEEAKSEGYVGLGQTVFNSHIVTGEVGYRTASNWDVGLQLIGEGSTDYGRQNEVWAASVSHIIKPGWGNYFMRLGVAYVRDSPLVGDTNFKLGFGWDFGPVEVELIHMSSASIHTPNRGVDTLMFRTKF